MVSCVKYLCNQSWIVNYSCNNWLFWKIYIMNSGYMPNKTDEMKKKEFETLRNIKHNPNKFKGIKITQKRPRKQNWRSITITKV